MSERVCVCVRERERKCFFRVTLSEERAREGLAYIHTTQWEVLYMCISHVTLSISDNHYAYSLHSHVHTQDKK